MHAYIVYEECRWVGTCGPSSPALKMCHTIVVGIDILRHKGKIVVAFASTSNKVFTEYYSRVGSLSRRGGVFGPV